MPATILFGPSGAGKSAVMAELCLSHGFTLINTVTTSPFRIGSQRQHVNNSIFDQMAADSLVCQVTNVYEARYALVHEDLSRCISSNEQGVIDFNFRGKELWIDYNVTKIILIPPDREDLKRFLHDADRGHRFEESCLDLDIIERWIAQNPVSDFHVIRNRYGMLKNTVEQTLKTIKRSQQ